MTDLLAELTPPQREAVTHLDGPLLVVAGAGSGKTRVVTRRIAFLVSQGVWPNQILAMTFTNKAAREMQERVTTLVQERPRWVGTFHSVCARLLRHDIQHLDAGRDGNFTIYDAADQKSLMKQCLRDLAGGDSGLRPGPVLARISRHKRSASGLDGEPAAAAAADPLLSRIQMAYEERLRAANALDFDDLLLLTVQLLEACPALRDVYHSRFRHLLVDEYQDTNRVQYRLIRLLAGPARNVHVTGDPDQSIYSWRGADYRNIEEFDRHFPGTRLVRLEQNYRSTGKILLAANALIRHNTIRIEKELFSANPAGEPVNVIGFPDDRSEAHWVAAQAVAHQHAGAQLQDMAVFYRTNAQSRLFEESLIAAGIPYQIVGGIRFYERREIKDILAWLRLLVNPRDVISLQRVIGCGATGVGPKTLAALVQDSNRLNLAVFELLQREDFRSCCSGRVSSRLHAFQQRCRRLGAIPRTSLSGCVHGVLQESGLLEHYAQLAEPDSRARQRLENLEAFLDRAAEFEADRPEASLQAFLEEVALVSDVDSWEDARECLSLMTLHSAKGLEFRTVFVVGVEEGLLPHQNARSPRQIEEERRLLYVGLTRAREELAVSWAARRLVWGQPSVSRPSVFLSELDEEGVCCRGVETFAAAAAAEDLVYDYDCDQM